MQTWKQILLKAFGLGLGIGLGFGVFLAAYLWYVSRPVPEAPWNSNAITASFRMVDTEGDDQHLVFSYILENSSGRDYRVKAAGLSVAGVIKEKNSLSGFGYVKVQQDAIFIPAGQRAVLSLALPDYKYTERPNPDDDEELSKYREALRIYVDKELSGLNGFAAYEDANRFQINFPNGWHKEQGQN